MPRIDAVVECPLHDSFHVQQVIGMFDLQAGEILRSAFSVEVPDLTEEWSIGLIVGPSASGKTTVARVAFGDAVRAPETWPDDQAVIDCLGDHPIKTITHMLGAVGFSTPPSWIKPYTALSNGERFRCELARALLRDEPLIVFDEFTCVVDRTVAKIGSAAVAKAIRNGRIPRRFVAVTCHYDIAEWLEPDWVLDMASGTLTRGRLRRPSISLEVTRCTHDMWRLFAKHHYLNAGLHDSATCYLATWNEEPIAFAATLPAPGCPAHDRVSRIVVLPDYQGIGIGTRLISAVGSIRKAMGRRLSCITGHPGIIAALRHHPEWIAIHVYKAGTSRGDGKRRAIGRAVVSFIYRG